jgi:hypothetical protein
MNTNIIAFIIALAYYYNVSRCDNGINYCFHSSEHQKNISKTFRQNPGHLFFIFDVVAKNMMMINIKS